MTKYLFIGDTHVGSLYGVMPPKFQQYNYNSVQKKIFSEWKKMCHDVGKVDVLVLMGDMVDGTGKNSKGKDMWTTDIDKQIECAKELVDMIEYDKSAIVYGSPYHVEENLNADQMFAKKINATWHDNELVLKPKNDSGLIHIAHNISPSSSAFQYRTSGIAKELMMAVIHENVLGKIKAIVRAHAHFYVHVEFSSNMGWVNPCWETRTPYMIRKGLGLIPKLGYVVLEVEGGRWSKYAYLFDMPPMEVKTF